MPALAPHPKHVATLVIEVADELLEVDIDWLTCVRPDVADEVVGSLIASGGRR